MCGMYITAPVMLFQQYIAIYTGSVRQEIYLERQGNDICTCTYLYGYRLVPGCMPTQGTPFGFVLV